MLPSLYPHQQEICDRLRESLRRHRASILAGITGFGKSRVAKWVAAKSADSGARVLITVHRRGLVDNMVQNFAQSPHVPYGVIMSGEGRRHDEPIQIASIDSMLSWYLEDGKWTGDLFDLIIFDECHSHLSKFSKFLMAHNVARVEHGEKHPFVLGLSATPEAKGLGSIFRDIVTGPSAVWLQGNGYASKFRYVAGKTKGRFDQLVKRGGEYTKQSVHEAFRELQGDFLRDWKKWASDRPTVGFFPRRDHAREAMAELRRIGVRAAYVDGETPDDERRQIYEDVGNGVEYLANVGVVERGTDIPCLECVQLCLSIGSRVRYRQMIGRACRVFEGKSDAMVLDHGGNVVSHGGFEDDIDWTLDEKVKATEKKPRPQIECPECGRIYAGGLCVCGREPTVRELRAERLTWNGEELKEIQPKSQTMKPEKKFEKQFVGMLYVGARSRRGEMTFGQVCAMARKRGVSIPSQVYGREVPSPSSMDWHRGVTQVFPFLAKR